MIREYGYAPYRRQLERDRLIDLVPLDLLDAAQLPPGDHAVRVGRLQFHGEEVTIPFHGSGRRSIYATWPRSEMPPVQTDDEVYVTVGYTPGCQLARNGSGEIVALAGDGGVAGVFNSTDEARDSVQVRELVVFQVTTASED